ncbi:MAG TPA: hypothetical protein VF116_20765 [Ktedonobacterales bacterium]
MRCENCGREIDNAQLWQLGADPKAPSAWSMRVLCWDCRAHPQGSANTSSTRTDEPARIRTGTPPARDDIEPEARAS